MKALVLIAATIGGILIMTQARPCTPPPEECTMPCFDGVFALDVSNSIGSGVDGEERFDLMKNFISTTFDQVTISPNCSRAGLILFANDTKIKFNLSRYTDRPSLRSALNEIKLSNISGFRQSGGTNTPGVLRLMKSAAEDGRLGLSKDNRIIQIAIVITDGRPHIHTNATHASTQTKIAGNELRMAGIYEQIYAIGIEGTTRPGGLSINKRTLSLITGTNESTFLLNNFSNATFQEAAVNLSAAFCNLAKSLACLSVQCPNGSRCRVLNETGETYCEYSCTVDNGGCNEGSQCIEVDVPTCSPGQCCSPVNITCLPNCTIEGQVYSEQAPPPEHQPTCNKPNRTYCPTAAPHPGCVCPNGTVIDEIQKRCVLLPECTCSPQCSHDYCSLALAKGSDTLIPCMRGFPPYTEADCMNDCKKTNCQLCDYYYRSPTDDPVYICI